MELDIKVPHNKKRNVGLVYNFLIQNIAAATIKEQTANVELAKKIIKIHFQKESELIKELKLFKKILGSNFKSQEIASRFLSEIKSEAKKIETSKLETEKTILIHEINKNLNQDGKFYNQFIKEYKLYATIQVLLSHWGDTQLNESSSKINYLVLEDNLVSFLTSTKQSETDSILESTTIPEKIASDKLVNKLMHKKFEEKYSTCLNERQKKILGNFISDNKKQLLLTLQETKEYIISEIENKSGFKSLLEEVKVLTPAATDEHCTFFIGVLGILRENNGEKI